MKKIVLIGDSIRMGYDKYVKEAFSEVAEVYYPADNCRFATYILRFVHEWKKKGEWPDDVDLVHWNAGLWDVPEILGDEPVTPIDQYAVQIARIDKRLRLLFPSAKIVFATSTAVEEEKFGPVFKRKNATIEAFNAAAIKAQIDAVIGADYDATSRPTDMEAAQVGGGFDSATFRLDAKPAFVFYPETDAEGNLVYDLSAYRFTQNGKALAVENTTVEGRACIVIATYAYEIADNISYSIDGTEISGEFNVKAYYEFALTQNNEALVSIVERLWKYSEAAKAYKAEATSRS